MQFHHGIHLGRSLEFMIEGVGLLSGLLLSFFREHCAAFVPLLILLPMTVFVNWRLGSLLVVLVAVFAGLITVVLRRTESLQGQVQRHHSDLAEYASDALGNVPVIQ